MRSSLTAIGPGRILCLSVCFLFGSHPAQSQGPAPNANTVEAKPPLLTELPDIAGKIQDAMQSRAYGEAGQAIEAALASQTGGPPDYLRYLQGIAFTEEGKHDEAIGAFLQLEQSHPDSPWVSRSRFGRAHVHVLRREYIEAGKIYQQEAERLLSRDRKDMLAQIYLEYADRYFDGVPSDDPSQQKKPDYQQALTYYQEASKLGTTSKLAQQIDFRIARCQEELDKTDEAIASYQGFLNRYRPDGNPPEEAASSERIAEVQFRIGDVELKAARPAKARRIWQDFITQWSKSDDVPEAVESFLARAQYRLAHTWGLPSPNSISELELAVSAAETFLDRYPGHALAPQTELEIAQGYAKHQRHTESIQRLRSLLENEQYRESETIPVAREMLGREHLAQGEYDLAIQAWKEFLEEHPTDPKWPEVQGRIVDAEYAKGKEALEKKKYQEARSFWVTFLNKYPLDPRSSSILLQFGKIGFSEAEAAHQKRVEAIPKEEQPSAKLPLSPETITLYEGAISDWRRVVAKYPETDEASQAAFLIGVTLEDKLERLAEAIESYRLVSGKFASQAKARIQQLTTAQLAVVTERKYRSNEQPRIKLATRNLEKVDVKIYRIDMVDYFRKMHLASGVEDLDIALIDPDQQFEQVIEGFQPYKQIERSVDLPIEGPGVSAVTVTSDKLESTTMVVVSDLDMVVKASRNELFLFVEDMLKQAPAQDVTILISDGDRVFAEAKTNADGILQQDHEQLREIDDLRLFAIRNDHTAATLCNLEGLPFSAGLSPRGYVYTDRPAYRSGQVVNMRGIVRWVEADRHTFRSGEPLQLDVFDPRGRQLLSQSLELGDYGTISSQLLLPDAATQGDYRIHLHREKSGEGDPIGDLSFDGSFRVAEYQLEPIEIDIELEKDIYFRGETVHGTIHLRYYYGMPLAGETIQYRLGPDGELVSVQTDQEGKANIDLETQRFNEAQPLQLTVEYPERNLQSAKTVYLATRGFAITASTTRDVFLVGESFETLFNVSDPAGKPVAMELKVEVFKLETTYGGRAETLVETQSIHTDPDSGQAAYTFKIASGGPYLLRATGVDQFGNRITGQTQIQVSGDEDSTRLRILADRLTFTTGEQASVNVHWREQPALALVTLEGARVLSHRLVMLQEGNNALEIPINSEFAPNVFLHVAVMHENQFHAAQSELRVTQQLRVTAKPLQETLEPGSELTVDIEVTDPAGKPRQAELSLAVVQAGLLAAHTNPQGSISPVFSAGVRRRSVRQSSSCTFDYRPQTRSISDFVLAERERRTVRERESRALEAMGSYLGDEISDLFADDMEMGMGMHMEMGIDFDANANAASANQDAPLALGFAGNQVLNESMQQQLPVGGFGGAMGGGERFLQRQPQQAGAVPNVRYRTEIRNGRQIQVPYFTLPNVAQVELPIESRTAAYSYYFDQLSRANQSPAASFAQTASTKQPWQSRSFNGVTPSGKMVTVNASNQTELTRLAREQNLQLIPTGKISETAHWDPTIVTDADGKASVTLTMPQQSTAWQIHTKGIDAETLAGEDTAEVITKKSLFAELKLPTAFTVGDRVRIPVEVHLADGDDRTITVKLKSTIGEKSIEESREVKIRGKGITPVEFNVEIESADQISLETTLLANEEVLDQSSQTVMIRPDGYPVYRTAGGTASQSTLALLQFDSSLNPQGVTLQLSVGPSLNRWLIDSVLGHDAFLIDRCLGPTATPIERSTSDILGGVAVMKTLRGSLEKQHPDAQAVQSRILTAIGHLVSSQSDQGSWSWSGAPSANEADPYLSARVMWAWSVAREAGFPVPQTAFELGKTYLKTAFASSPNSDLERQAVLLHAMSVSGAGDFALANRLYRERNRLDDSGLIHLILTMVALRHPEMANDLIELVKLTAEQANPARGTRRASFRWMQDPVEIKAMYLFALQAAAPTSPKIPDLARSLLASRIGSRWPIEKSNGPAISAIASWLQQGQSRAEKYRLKISVNEHQLTEWTCDPAVDGSRLFDVPAEWLSKDKPQRIEFELDGRATFSYSAVLSGFIPSDTIASSTKTWTVDRRYEPQPILFAGRPIPRGFGVVDGNYQWFTNPLTQLAVGRRAEVTLSPRRHLTPLERDQNQNYLVLTEPIPAGASVLAGSVRGSFERYEIEAGKIVFFIGTQRYPGDIHYTLVGYLPGQYRIAPSLLRDYYNPDEFSVATTKTLEVLPSGAESRDEYKLSPDELYHLGQAEFERGEHSTAHQHLSQLHANWQLDPDKLKNVVQWLFASSLVKQDHGDIVRYFEILKEKFPDVEVSFEDILQVASSYREIGEYERGFLVYRATVEGSFERESQVAGFLNVQGEFARSVRELERLLRDYPAESYLATATYALAQETYRRAATTSEEEALRSQGLTRVHLIDAAIKMLDHFITVWPEDPANDEASFALATALIDLEQYDAVIQRSEQFANRYPNSRLLDSFWYMMGYGHFEMEHPQEALKICRKVAEATFPEPETGGIRAADNRWEAVYIMGQVYHSLGQAASAIAEYTKVKDRFADAAEAIQFFNRKSIEVDEVTTIRPDAPKELELRFRNIDEVSIKIYRIDLMKFGLMQRNLDRITAINLAGIRPYHEANISLGDGRDYRDRKQPLALPLEQEGAYLLVCRGGNLYTSGLILVTPLTLQVQEDGESGRIRVSVKNLVKDTFVSDVHVKVIGSANQDFESGDTDLRGLFIADDIRGTSTVIAANDAGQYAFFRGETVLQPGSEPFGGANDPFGAPAAQAQQAETAPQATVIPQAEAGKKTLRDNLFRQNSMFQEVQKGNYQDLMNNDRSGIKSKEAF